MSGLSFPKLNNNESNTLEGMISYKQASESLKHMRNGRSPGTDGFSADFFKTFWKQLGHFVVRSINYGYINWELSVTQREGVIICLSNMIKTALF